MDYLIKNKKPLLNQMVCVTPTPITRVDCYNKPIMPFIGKLFNDSNGVLWWNRTDSRMIRVCADDKWGHNYQLGVSNEKVSS